MNDDARERAEHQWKIITGKADIAFKKRDADRKDRETDNRIDIGLGELELAAFVQTNAPAENTKLTAIASPNS